MTKVFIYSLLLIAGMALSYLVDLNPIRFELTTVTMACLSYIMIEVGLEFTLNKGKLRSYGKDYLIAMTAALFPWIFCALYFYYIFHVDFGEALLIGRFAAPTSAGILFTMLSAVGLGTTWLFRKARILAIFDDLDTILIMIPLQMVVVGWRWELTIVIPILLLLLFFSYKYLHRLRWPSHPIALLCYGIVLVLFSELLMHTAQIQIEVILPAFALGCLLFNPHDPNQPRRHYHEHAYIEPEEKPYRILDTVIKVMFMFLVGASLPSIEMVNGESLWMTVFEVLIITVLANIGKMFPTLCYRGEATFRERLALSIAMWPRGEVGAGVLLVTIDYGIRNKAISIAELSLALNLLLTGVFIWVVIKLIEKKPPIKA